MRLTWKIYAILYSAIVVASIRYALSPDSQLFLYYAILSHMHNIFLISSINRYLFFYLEALGLAPLFFFVFKKYPFPALIWQGFFIIRVTNALAMVYFEQGFYKNLFKINTVIAGVGLVVWLLAVLPVYIALFIYAFRRDDLFSRH